MERGHKVLTVDDDPKVCEILKLYLEKEGFSVWISTGGKEALKTLEKSRVDLLILDVMMPEIDGWDVLKFIRNNGKDIPVLMLTAKTEDYDKILGLDLGADDYVEKPFNPVEVVSRVKAILRRTKNTEEKKGVLYFPGLKIDHEKYEVLVNNIPVDLTPKEVRVLTCLARNPGRVYSREQLLSKVWGYDFAGENRNIDVHIKHIRDKLKTQKPVPWKLETVWGVGYRFVLKKAGI